MNPDLEVGLTIRLPNGGKILRVAMKLDEYLYEQSFAPLPRDREIPLEVKARMKAAEQVQMRRAIARDMATAITNKMLELLKENDPQHGYSPEEWRRINET